MNRLIYTRLALNNTSNGNYDEDLTEEYTLQKEFPIEEESYETYLDFFEKILILAGYDLTKRRLAIIDSDTSNIIHFRKRED